jgi:hypothetical protein
MERAPTRSRPPRENRRTRTADRPRSARFRAGGSPEGVPPLVAAIRTRLRRACRARTVWQCRPVPSLSGLLPPSPASPGSGCSQLQQAAATARRRRSLTSSRFGGASWRTRSTTHRCLPQAGTVGHPAAGDPGGDAAGAELAAVLVVVIATVGEQLPRSAASAADRRHGVDQGDQLGDVVTVAAGEGDRQRDAAGVADQVVLGAGAAVVDRGGADVIPLSVEGPRSIKSVRSGLLRRPEATSSSPLLKGDVSTLRGEAHRAGPAAGR